MRPVRLGRPERQEVHGAVATLERRVGELPELTSCYLSPESPMVSRRPRLVTICYLPREGARCRPAGRSRMHEVGSPGADDRVRVVDVVEVAADERRHARLVADAVAERGQEAAPVLRPVVVDRLARLDVDQVAAALGDGSRDRDAVVDGVAARVPVGDREPDGERARPTSRTASSTSSGKRSRSSSRIARAARGSSRADIRAPCRARARRRRARRPSRRRDELLADRRLVRLARDGAERAIGPARRSDDRPALARAAGRPRTTVAALRRAGPHGRAGGAPAATAGSTRRSSASPV